MSRDKLPPIIYTPDKDYIFPAMVSLVSLLRHAPSEHTVSVYFLMEQEYMEQAVEMTDYLAKRYSNLMVRYVNVNTGMFSGVSITTPHLTRAAYYRLFISDYIRAERCLYLDGDTIVTGDISGLLSVELEDYYIGAVKGLYLPEDKEMLAELKAGIGIGNISQYVNSGVLLMNLEKIRSDGLTEDFSCHLEKNYPSEDQDILNICCEGKIRYLAFKYNFPCRFSGAVGAVDRKDYSEEEISQLYDAPVILHFLGTSVKPWLNRYVKNSDLWWSYAEELRSFSCYETFREKAETWMEGIDWMNFLKHCREYNKIVIFGQSVIGRTLAEALLQNGIMINCFCDNDMKKQQMVYQGIKTYSVNEIKELLLSQECAVINTSQRNAGQVRHQLEEAGVKKNRILNYFHKNRLYYMSIEDKFYMSEFRQIMQKETEGSIELETLTSREWKAYLRDREDIVKKYWMTCWLLQKGEEICRKNP